MDDGMQFANQENNGPAIDETQTIYRVWWQTTSGQSVQYHGNDKAAADAAVAKHEEWNARARASKSPFGPKVREYFVEVIEPEVQEAEAEEISEVVEAEEVASTETEATEISEVVEKNFKVVVKGGRQSGTHQLDTLAEAKELVSFEIGKCSQVYIQGMPRNVEGCYWDEYDQYRQDWNAGKFNAAFERDLVNS